MICLKLKNLNNDSIDVEIIRYFLNNDAEYLIYSLNEIDQAGYTKLYASKIIGNKASIISDDSEWSLIKEIIKQIVKANRDGSPLEIIDLNERNLSDVVLSDTRVFKLQGNLVNLLAENKKVKDEPIFEDEEDGESKEVSVIEDVDKDVDEIEPVKVTTLEEEEASVNYEEMYNSLLIENEFLKQQIEQLNSYKEKYEKIKEILD